MEFADFDDDLFEEKCQSKKEVIEYTARVCEDGWFLHVDSSNVVSAEDNVGIMKFGAEYHFMKKEYEAAMEKYKELLRILPANNSTIRRECFEGLSKCCIKTSNTSDAVKYAEQLHISSKTSDQLTVSCSVLLDSFLADVSYNEALKVAQNLITLHPDNFHLWMKLGFTYACMHNIVLRNVQELLNAHSPNCIENKSREVAQNPGSNGVHNTLSDIEEVQCINSTDKTERDQVNINTITNNDSQEHEKHLKLVAGCLQRAYSLLKKTEGTAVGFAVTYTEMYQKKLLTDLGELLDEKTLCHVKTAVSDNEKSLGNSSTGTPDEENCEFVDRGSSKFQADDNKVDFGSVSEINFESKWFKWL